MISISILFHWRMRCSLQDFKTGILYHIMVYLLVLMLSYIGKPTSIHVMAIDYVSDIGTAILYLELKKDHYYCTFMAPAHSYQVYPN